MTTIVKKRQDKRRRLKDRKYSSLLWSPVPLDAGFHDNSSDWQEGCWLSEAFGQKSWGVFVFTCVGGAYESWQSGGRFRWRLLCTNPLLWFVFLWAKLHLSTRTHTHTHTHSCCSGSHCVFSWRQRVQHLVKQLQCPVQVNLQPAGGVLDALTGVITPPTFNKAQTHDTQPAQVVHAQTCGWTHTWRKTGNHTSLNRLMTSHR